MPDLIIGGLMWAIPILAMITWMIHREGWGHFFFWLTGMILCGIWLAASIYFMQRGFQTVWGP